MIDRVARKQAAEAIRHFVSGRITNKEFIDRYPYSKNDPAIWALDDTFYAFYDDIVTHKLTGGYSISKGARKMAARWIMFLYSDCEYRWPRAGVPGLRSSFSPSWFGRVTGLARLTLWRDERFRRHGEYELWPFLQREEFEEALKKPVLLRGNI